MLSRIVIRWLINAIALFVAVRLLPGVEASDGGILAVALILGFVNAIIRPVLVFLTCPLIILTLGLFTLVINALMLQLAGSIGRSLGFDFQITGGFGTVFLAALIVSIVSFLLSLVVVSEGERGK
jgi:putative membrane protein